MAIRPLSLRLRLNSSLLVLFILLLLIAPLFSRAAPTSDDVDGDDDDEELTVTDEEELPADARRVPEAQREPDVVIIPEPTPPVASDPALPALLDHLQRSKVDTSAIRFFEGPRGRGLQTTRAVDVNTTLFSIPYSLLITTDVVREDKAIGKLVEHLATIDAFAVWLAANRHSNKTKFTAYLRTLPPFVPLPLFYAPTLLKEYEGTALESVAADRRATAYRVLSQFTPEIRAVAPKADYLWALSVLWSRSCAVAMKNPESMGGWRQVASLAPLVDMMNTGNASEVNVRCSAGKSGSAFKCRATRALAEGEELLVSYGPRSNAALVHDYGFALPTDNPHDFAVIDLPDPKHNKTKGDNHRVAFRKIEVYDELMRKIGNGRTEHDLRFKLVRPTNFTDILGVFGPDVLGWARLHTVKRYEHANLTAYDMIDRIMKGQPFSAPNTLEAVKLIHRHVRKAIRRYPTTIEEDYAALNDSQAFAGNAPLYWIVMVRYSEKAILHDVAQWITINLPVLEEAAASEIEWRRQHKANKEREKKEKEEAERKKASERERLRKEEDAREAARLKAIEDEEEEAEAKKSKPKRSLKPKKLYDELRRL